MTGDKSKRRLAAAADSPLIDRIHCRPGWLAIVLDFVAAAQHLPAFVLVSAGEKLGTLTLDYDADPSAINAVRALEQDAIDESSRTCEVCGADGFMRTEGWHKVLCDRHALQRNRVTSTDVDITPEQAAKILEIEMVSLKRRLQAAVGDQVKIEEIFGELDDGEA